MNVKYVIITMLLVAMNIFCYHFYSSIVELCDLKTCPDCFGTNMCSEIQQNNIGLQYNSIRDFVYNIFSVKNVYFAHYGIRSVVLKKLAHNSELRGLNIIKSVNYEELINFLISDVSDVKQFKICDEITAISFLKSLNHKDNKNLQTLLHINIEPILLELFNSSQGWPVPKLYGFCGRLVVVENAGQPLNQMENYNWFDRAYIAFQILQAMNNFTKNHETFRLYLTDISPDNIVVAQDLKVTFVDLENAILKQKTVNGIYHYSEHIDKDSYMYSEAQICRNSISDHNIYSACQLLLSQEAPWPMMKNGLLHNPPEVIKENFSEVFLHIELCVDSPNKINRFKLSNEILKRLSYILKKYTKYL